MVHEHLCLYVKKTTGIDADLTLLGERSNCHHDELNSLERRRKKQEVFNCRMEVKILDLEGTIEGQVDCIVELEDEVAILRSRKECKCGGIAGSTSGSGSAEDPIDLEYTDEEGLSLGGSYHTPPRVKEEPLRIIRSPISQHLPEDVQTTCGCLAPNVFRIRDDVELVAVPQENKRLIPVRVEEPLRYNMDVQRASQGHPQAHYSSHHINCHAKQTGYSPYPCPAGYCLDETLRFPSQRGLAIVLGTDARRDHHSVGTTAGAIGTLSDVPVTSNSRSLRGPSTAHEHSMSYCQCSLSCGGDCLGGNTHLCWLGGRVGADAQRSSLKTGQQGGG